MKDIKEFFKKIADIKSIQSIETNNKTMGSKPHINIVVSKRELKDGDIDLIYKLLDLQNYYEWTFNIVA